MSGRIVVGVDGSDASAAALRWALREARLRGAAVEAVHAWQLPYSADLAVATDPSAATQMERQGRHLVEHTIDAAGPVPVGITVERFVVSGGPAHVLLEQARGATLLVVGSHGRGGFAGWLLGSVSRQCAHHAPCPLVIVPLHARRVKARRRETPVATAVAAGAV